MTYRGDQRKSSLTSMLDWKAIALGFGVAAALGVGAGVVGGGLGLEGHLGAYAATEFVALMVGGYVAARVAGRVGVMQALAVAVIFIVISASVKAWVEIDLAGRFGPGVLGPMDMGGLVLGDLIHLVGAWAGGWLADTQRVRAGG